MGNVFIIVASTGWVLMKNYITNCACIVAAIRHSRILKGCIVAAVLSLGSNMSIAKPVARFSANPVSGCNPLKVDFINQSSGATSYLWTLGNGNNSTLHAPSAVYNVPGKYSVTLIVTDATGKKDTLLLIDFITVFKSPVAAFGVDKKTICIGDTALFFDKSIQGDGPISKANWDFGNGDVGTGLTIAYQYNVFGTFDITYAIEDVNGCISTIKEFNYEKVHPQPGVNFTSTDRIRCKAPSVVKFNSTVSGFGPFKYNWQLDSGIYSTAANPQHSYTKPGKFNVSLTVTDGRGCKTSKSANEFVIIAPPVAQFDLSAKEICQGQTAQFFNQSWPSQLGDSVRWQFSDGYTSNEQSPVRKFTKAGTYDVKLTYYWDNCVAVADSKSTIKVKPTPYVKIVPRDTMVCRTPYGNLQLNLKGNDYYNIQWQRDNRALLPEDTTSTYVFPIDTNGTYKLIVHVLSPIGCGEYRDTATVKVVGPFALIDVSKSGGCMPYNSSAQSVGFSKDSIIKYTWYSPELNLNGNKKKLDFTNNKFGWSRIYHTVTDKNGCVDRAFAIVGAGIPVDASFSLNKKVICSNEPLTIYNHSKQKHPDTTMFLWSWFGNDTIPLTYGDSNVVKFRTKPGDSVKLTFTSTSYGCASQDFKYIKVLGPLLEGSVHLFCDQDTLRGVNNSIDYTSTYWRYVNSKNKTTFNPDKYLKTNLYGTKDVWLFAFNDTNKCADSMLLELKYNPVDAMFNFTVDCNSRILKTTNPYIGLHDTMFKWTLTNHTKGTVYKRKSRILKNVGLATGDYSLLLEIEDKRYVCTKSHTENFTIHDWDAMRPKVIVDDKSCYPINLTLNDDYFKLWKNAFWTVDQKTILKDSTDKIHTTYAGSKNMFNVKLFKTDQLGCSREDQFNIPVGGPMAEITFEQDNTNCNKPLINFIAKNNNYIPDIPYFYEWDFGHRTSKLSRDTVQLNGAQTLNVTLSISTANGCKSTISKTINFITGKPKALFTHIGDTIESCPPLNATFKDLSNGGYAPITNYNWNFGDNSFSVKQNPSKIYVIPGKYSVSLIVTNAAKCKDTFSIPDMVVVKGPNGVLNIDQYIGCTPFKVALISKTTGSPTKMNFDMGDGVVLDSSAKNHIYTRPGRYIPRVILIDSNGCRFSPEPKDTIVVHPSPVASFTRGPVCNNKPYIVVSNSKSLDPLSSIQWTSSGKIISTADSFTMMFNKGKYTHISLNLTTVNNCRDSISRVVLSYGLKPAVVAPKEEFCLGETVKLKNGSVSDTTLAKEELWINNMATITTKPMNFVASSRGRLSMKYTMTDVLGCTESLYENEFIKVGDTTPPPALKIYRTSVIDNFSTQTKFAASEQPDFKEYNLYVWMNNRWQKTAQSYNQLDTNLVSHGLNTLAKSYCHVIRERNFCGVSTDSISLVPHCTIETKAFGDTNLARVSWTPYVGWKVQSYNIWRKRSTDTKFEIVGTVPGSQLNYIDTAIWCHIKYDYKIEGMEEAGYGENSFSDTAIAKPIHLLQIPAPEMWRTTVIDNKLTYSEWKMTERLKYPLAYYTVNKFDGVKWETIPEKVSPEIACFHDKNTQVQNTSYTYTVTATDVCHTTSPESNVGKSIVLKVTGKDAEQNPTLEWTPYIFWNEGIENYRVERSIAGGPFIEVGRVDGKTLKFTDKNLAKTCVKDFVYRVVATRNQPARRDSSHFVESVSNYTDFIPEIRFYVPNAFTPDQNNLNEIFRPDGAFFYSYEMRIYNRWGQKIYDGNTCLNGWDGRYQNEISPEGVYAYHIMAVDMAGKSYQFSGSFHLLR